MQFLKEWGTLAGSIAAIIALFATLYKPIKKHVAAKHAKRKAFEDSVLSGIKDIKDEVKALTDDVAEIQGDRLMQAHAFYMSRGWCSSERKKILCAWKQSYTAKGYNHLVDTYEDDINSLPENPPQSVRTDIPVLF